MSCSGRYGSVLLDGHLNKTATHTKLPRIQSCHVYKTHLLLLQEHPYRQGRILLAGRAQAQRNAALADSLGADSVSVAWQLGPLRPLGLDLFGQGLCHWCWQHGLPVRSRQGVGAVRLVRRGPQQYT
jgi:hypothetical protein